MAATAPLRAYPFEQHTVVDGQIVSLGWRVQVFYSDRVEWSERFASYPEAQAAADRVMAGPLPADSEGLRLRIAVDEGQGDLLSPVPDGVHGGGEFPHLLRLRALLESRGLTGSGGDVQSGFVEGLELGLHLGSLSSGSPAASPQDAAATVNAHPRAETRTERCDV